MLNRNVKGYILEDEIGKGGFGTIYRARQASVERDVAIKVIRPQFASQPDFIRRFEKEAQFIARLEHLHITPLYDFWRDQSGAYLVMRYLRGGSLRDALEQRNHSLEEIINIIDQIANALSYSHQQGIIHRDLKPGNILLDEDGNAYLGDFGIAKSLLIDDGKLTEPDAITGSLDYLSPEQARGEPVSPRTDIYSLGVVVFEVLAGHHPFKEFSSVERLYKHINDPLPLIESLDDSINADVNDVIQKATAKNPDNRYGDVLAFASALRDALNLNPTEGKSPTPEEILTLREQEVLSCLAHSMSNREIADSLFITVSTVKWYNKTIFRKLGVRNRVQAVVKARELDLILTEGSPTQTHSIPTPVTPLDGDLDNPYRGLHAFQAGDANLFFGRDQIIKKLLKRIRNERFLAVVGPSGSGKSSLVRAGVIPALWRGEVAGSENWFVVDMLPGTVPLDSLEVALTRIASDQTTNLYEHLHRDKRGLLRASDLILPDDDSELVIVIDQFEELFSLVDDDDARQFMLDLIYETVNDSHSRVRIIITLRADFYDRPLHYPQFGAMLREHMETILPLTPEELTRAIVEPAKFTGVVYEQGLVPQIVSDVNYQAGALPLLQYALTELFERRKNRLLTWDAYREIGGAIGALAHRADELFRDLHEEAQQITRQIFLRLVTLGEGTEDTRRRVAKGELLSIADTDMMEEIIDLFVDYRLLSLDHDEKTRKPTVEVAHEAILREWDRLREWLNASREDIRQHRQLARLTAEWYDSKQDMSFLLRGGRLERFSTWEETTAMRLTPNEKHYLHTSRDVYRQEQEAEQARQEREATLEQRSQQRMRYLVAALAVMLIGAVAFSIFAIDREQQANDARIDAESARATSVVNAAQAQELAMVNAARVALTENDTETALTFAMQVNQTDSPSAQAQAILAQAGYSPGTVRLFEHNNPVWNLDVNAEHGLLLTVPFNNSEKSLFDLETGELVQRFGQSDDAVPAGAGGISADGEVVAYGQSDGVVVLYSVATGDEIRRLEIDAANSILDLVFLPDNQHIVVGYSGFDNTGTCAGDMLMWDYQTGDIVRDFEVASQCIPSLTLTADGEQVIVGGSTNNTMLPGDIGFVSIYDLNTGEEMQRIGMNGNGHQAVVLSAVMTPDERLLVSFSADNRIIFWDVTTGEPLHTVEDVSPNWSHTFLEISPDGRTVAINFDDQTRISFYDTQTFDVVRSLSSNITLTYRLAFLPDSRHIVAVGNGGATRLIDTGFGAQTAQITAQLNVDALENVDIPASMIAFSPSYDRMLYTPRRHGTFTDVDDVPAIQAVYDLETGTLLAIHQHDGLVNATGGVFVGDNLIATSYRDGTVLVWNVNTGEEVRRLTSPVPDLEPYSQSQSFNTRYMVLGPNQDQIGQDLPIVILDMENGEATQIAHDSYIFMFWKLSPDGRYLLTSTTQKQILVWDVSSGELLYEFDGHTPENFSQVGDIDSESQTVLSFNSGEGLHWNIETGEVIQRFELGNTVYIFPMLFASEGMIFVGEELQLYDIESATLLRTFSPQDFRPRGTYVTPDNRLIVLPFRQDNAGIRTLQWWRLDSQDNLINWIEDNRYVREFTCQERELYNIAPLCSDE